MTAPSIASHRNRIEANSSDHTSGCVEHVARDDAAEQDHDLDRDQRRRRNLDDGAERRRRARRSQRGETPPRSNQRATESRSSTMASRELARRISRGWPMPPRRTCPSTRCRSRPMRSLSRNGAGSGWLKISPLPARSCCRVAFSLATSSRSFSPAALMCLATIVAHVVPAAAPRRCGSPGTRSRPTCDW